MNKRELISELEFKIIKQKKYSNEFVDGSDTQNNILARLDGLRIALYLVKQLDEPQTEKVEITERQERLLKKYEDEPFHRLLNNCRTDEEDLLARARLNGYTIKSKRWVVKNKEHIGLESFINGTVNPVWTTEEPLWMTFTDKAKAEAVATLVEGTVEEVSE